MSYVSGRSSKANPHADVNKHKYASVGKYVEEMSEWKMWPSSCINGELFIIFHGHSIPYAEFMELQPIPNVADFKTDLTNVDEGQKWINS